MLHAALANSKEHELQVTASRGEDVWGGPAVLLAPEQARPTRARIFPQKRRTNTNLIDHARPAGRPVGSACGFSSPSDAGQVRLEPTANGSRRETSPKYRHFVDAHRYRMALRAQGGFRPGVLEASQLCGDQLASVSCSSASNGQTTCTGYATHCSQLVLIALAIGTAASSA